MKFGFRWRIVLSLWFVSGLFVLLTGVLTSYIFLQNERRLIEEKLQTTATTLSSMGITDYTGLAGFENLSGLIRRSLKLEEFSQTILIYTQRGKLMMQSPLEIKNKFLVEFFPVSKPTFLDFSYNNKSYKVLITAYTGKNGKLYYLNLSQEMPHLSDMSGRTFMSMGILFGSMCLLAFCVAQFLSRALIKPVKQLALDLNLIDFTKPGQLVTLQTPAEGDYLTDIVSAVNTLSVSVKEMLYRLSRTRRYLAHELGNPLTILSGEAQEILSRKNASAEDYKQVIESSVEEIDRMKNVIETVAKIARVEKSIYAPALINLTSWLPQQKDTLEKILKRPITLVLPDGDMLVMLDADLLFRLVENLVRNIEKHTEAYVTAQIELKYDKRPLLIVEDNGPGLSQDILDAMNTGRDYRFGIGLSLCNEIASICGFKLLFNNKASGGLRVIIQLE